MQESKIVLSKLTSELKLMNFKLEGTKCFQNSPLDAAAAEEDNVVIARESAPTTTPAPR